MAVINMSQIAKDLIGKTLVAMEFGTEADPAYAEESGSRYMPERQKIVNAYIGTTESDRDPCVWMELEGGTEVYAYANESITVE